MLSLYYSYLSASTGLARADLTDWKLTVSKETAGDKAAAKAKLELGRSQTCF